MRGRIRAILAMTPADSQHRTYRLPGGRLLLTFRMYDICPTAYAIKGRNGRLWLDWTTWEGL